MYIDEGILLDKEYLAQSIKEFLKASNEEMFESIPSLDPSLAQGLVKLEEALHALEDNPWDFHYSEFYQ